MSRTGAGAPRRRWLATGKIAFLVLAVAFGVLTVRGRQDALVEAISTIGWPNVLLAGVLAVIGVRVSANVWLHALAVVGADVPERAGTRVFFFTQVGKYLPGAVWPYVAQLRLAREMRVERSRVLMGQAVFLVLHLTTGVLVAAVTLPAVGGGSDVVRRYGVLLLPVLAGAACLHPSVLRRGLHLLVRRRGSEVDPEIHGARLALAAGWMLVTWGCYGASTAALVLPLAAPRVDAAAAATGAFSLAWTVGFLVVLAPAGAGAREVALVLALAPVLDTTRATAVALLSRGVMTAADLLLAACHGSRLSSTGPGAPPNSPMLRRGQPRSDEGSPSAEA